ncbi:MAG: HEAT repeat domain-containing protein [Candidatus Thermoplasmatota archaeon]
MEIDIPKDEIEEMLEKKNIDGIINALNTNDVGMRCKAIWALGKLKGDIAFDALIKTLKDSDTHVRIESINALREIGDKKAIPYLKELLNDDSTYEFFDLTELRVVNVTVSDVVRDAIEILTSLEEEKKSDV